MVDECGRAVLVDSFMLWMFVWVCANHLSYGLDTTIQGRIEMDPNL